MREYLLTMFVAAAVTYLLTPVARRVAVRWGAMTEVRDRDVHAIPTPRLGGAAMLLGFASALLVASQLPFLGEVFEEERSEGLAVLSGASLICLLGIADDKWGIDAITKLAGQVLAAGVMVLQGVQMLYLPIGGGLLGGDQRDAFVLGPAEGGVLTILVIVVTINAVNIVDGLDGLAAGIVAIAAMAFFSFSYILAVDEDLKRATASTLVTAALIGVCFGFLPHNFSPARVFMGDSGSMLLGLLLASSTIILTGNVDPNQISTDIAPSVLPLVLPIAVLVVPFADLLLAVVRRTRAGRSPFAPDKQHLHHRLLEIGHSHARAVIIMYLWSAVIAFAATALPFRDRFLDGTTLLVSLAAIVGLALYATVRIPRPRASHRR